MCVLGRDILSQSPLHLCARRKSVHRNRTLTFALALSPLQPSLPLVIFASPDRLLCSQLVTLASHLFFYQSREWIAYADLELSHGNNDRVNEIFGRCLRSSPSVPLWQFYLTYIRRTNPIDRSSPERALPARDVITKAFEFSLAHIGADIEAGSIWFDYIEFLKEGEVSSVFILKWSALR